MMLELLKDPRIFNYLILLLYSLSAVRWAWERSWWDTTYWMGAVLLQIVITFR